MLSTGKQLSYTSRAGRKSSFSSSEIRMVLLGKTGSGKSCMANSILGCKVFDTQTGSSSVTQLCCKACGEFCGRQVTLLDTPGLFSTHQTPEEVHKHLRESVNLLCPGPHAFLIVIRIGRFTQEEKKSVWWIKQAMGSHALSFSVVVFTHGDLLENGTSLKHCMMDDCKELTELVAECGGRYCVFNNQDSQDQEQVSKLLSLVEKMTQDNKGSYYTSRMLQKAVENLNRVLQDDWRVLNEKEELLKKKQEQEIKQWYDRELEMFRQKSKKETEDLMRMLELMKQNEKKLARDWEAAYRQETEENDKREKERKIQEIARMMKIRKEEEEKREALQEKLDKVTKMLEEQAGQEEKMKRAMEETMQRRRLENEKKERERELQLIEREWAIREKEEMKRDTLQKELNKLTRTFEEQRREQENREKQMEDTLRREREENQRKREIWMENHKGEKRRIEALQQELKLLKTKMEEQKVREGNLKRQLEVYLRRDREKYDKDICTLNKQKYSDIYSEIRSGTVKKSAEKGSTLATVTGYMQEMGLMGVNAALESIGNPCCVQ